MSRIVLGVSGGVAAYKAALLLRAFTEAGHDVRVVPTPGALHFVGAATFEALSGNPVTTDVWSDVPEVAHVRIGQEADLVVVAPATADLLARAATGRADDLLTATLLTAHCPVVFVPAMHTEMWLHPATQDNVATLRRRGAVVLPPAIGRLTGPDSGPGRLPEPADIAALAGVVLAGGAAALPSDLTGRRVVISAGGTREPLDPVRYLGNRSSGKQGWALARVAAARGAEVVLVAANVELPAPFGVRVAPVGTAEELRAAMLAEAGAGEAVADVVVMSAAVADFRPVSVAATKLKKGAASEPSAIELARNSDVLAELVTKRPPGQLVVGFAAETGDDDADVLTHARAKLARKGCDLLVVNDVSAGQVFGRADNAVVVLGAEGPDTEVPHGSKDAVAAGIWTAVSARLAPPAGA
ncbi:bifunctional phosphopantothenoylcysteine decarboxylase/phosphopantothenate--cysteine ligase CoaBC [Blastococcus saxobsidens]|uniref:Coenzyme A biosynthesis bifunctional protein CoaBC n=1 Tax=Blastococcus saxobsidens (strain DD2) TaxID=1146883 RepID=H6RVK0_BLASD|nr:bifunctional phosphopantothenoylcysteine decarboxylase/phosphopantothenate--cysteine ligase CoaBC [Blastococcus saxobsidens]CCG03275.1 Coenzyme A biosynthesis bifunctional protein coaBC [Includes: Phosphopantothenoylcysteine decarboxylase; Phosphopantothenate--cysteine ligase] [Blastococcus saxobsidens DD2]